MTPFFPHQIKGAAWAASRLHTPDGGAYLCHAVGTGKTRTALAVARVLKARRVLVLAPPVALGVWEREAKKWGVELPAHHYRGAAGFLPAAGDALILTNYEQLIGQRGDARVKALLRWAPDLVILDEAQMVKSPTAARTRAAMKVCKGRRRLLLSGTPAHTPLDWWSQFRIIAPHDPLWSRPYGEYKRAVAIMGGPDEAWVRGFREAEVEAAFARHVAPYCHVVAKDVLALPEPLESPVPLDLSGAERRAYAAMEDEMFAGLPDGDVDASTVLVQALRLHQMTGGWAQGVAVGDTKLRACVSLVAQRADHKVVIACRFSDEIRALREALAAVPGLRVRVIQGSTSPSNRTAYEDEFQSGGPGVLILQYQAGGVAITLSKANALILYSLDPSVIRDEQMRGRVWRPGQTGHVQILPLLANDTLDWVLYQGLRAKADAVDMARRIARAVRKGKS